MTPENIERKIAIAPLAAEDTFLAAAQGLNRDPLFGLPAAARDVIARHGSATKVVILGTRGFGSHLLSIQNRNFDAIASVDDFRCHSGALYYDTPIISTDKFLDLTGRRDDIIAVNTCRYDGPKRFFDQICRSHHVPHVNFEQAVRAFHLQGQVDYRVDDWGLEIIQNVQAYQALAKRFADDYSANTLFAVLNFHLTCEPEYYHEVERPYSTLYFRSGLLQFGRDEKMVDCGASIGESLMGLVGITKGDFQRSWMIEPDRLNIKTLQDVLRRFEGSPFGPKISLHACGVGERQGQVPFNHEGGHGGFVKPAAAPHEPKDLIDVRPIDDIVDAAPTFIKMDIEGSELSALKGARKTIQQYKPKLAISAYHRASDLLDISNYVLGLNPDYRIRLRHHTPDRWDTCFYFY